MGDRYFQEEEILDLFDTWKETGDENTFHCIVESSIQIVDEIINLYRFNRFDNYEDLKQESLMNIIKRLKFYDERKGSLFNYISGIAQQTCFFMTKSQQHVRDTCSDEYHEASYAVDLLYTDDMKRAGIRAIQRYTKNSYYKKSKLILYWKIIIDKVEARESVGVRSIRKEIRDRTGHKAWTVSKRVRQIWEILRQDEDFIYFTY